MDAVKQQGGVSRYRFTVEEYRKMGEASIFHEDDRVELIDGEVVRMPPIGWRHVWCVNALTMLLARSAHGRYVVSVQNPLVVSEYGEPQPDLVLIRDLSPGRLPAPADVVLVGEVADTTLSYDKNVKLPRYAAAGVPEVWLLNLANDTIEVHSEPESEGYRKTTRYGGGQRVISATLPNLAFATDEVLLPREPGPER